MKINKIVKYGRNALALLLTAVAVVGCGTNEIFMDTDHNPSGPDIPGEIIGEMTNANIWGTVTDEFGNPLAGVSVVSGGTGTTTNEYGFFSIDRADRTNNGNQRYLVKFSKEGYFPVMRNDYDENSTTGWNVGLSSESSMYASVDEFHSSTAHTIAAMNMEVKLPADGYVVASTGKKYSGTVNAKMLYLSPDNDLFTDLMPGGDLLAIDNKDNELALMSYGMTEVTLTDDDGNHLQLANGKNATLSFPAPASMESSAPRSIPLWSFDETKGYWVREGEAIQGADGKYTGEASHFSWWNIDTDEETAYIRGTVTNTDGERLQGIKILFNHGQRYTYSDANGNYTAIVQSKSSFNVRVPSEEYGNYADFAEEFDVPVEPIMPGATKTLDIVLPKLHCIYGDVVDAEDNPVRASYLIEYSGNNPKWSNTDATGHFKYYMPRLFEGNVGIKATDGRSSAETESFYFNGHEDIYKQLVLSNSGSTIVPGEPDIIANCGNNKIYYLSAARTLPTDMGGVIIQDGWFTAISSFNAFENDADRVFILQFSGYKPDQSDYDTNVVLMAKDGKKNVICTGGKINIKENNGNYTINLSGNMNGFYYGSDLKVSQASVTVNNVEFPHLVTLERKENYTPSSPFPAFTPKLKTPAPIAILFNKSEKFGNGGILFYNGGESEFNELMQQADKGSLPLTYKDLSTIKETGGDALYSKGTSSTYIEAFYNESKITESSWRGIPLFYLGDIVGGDDEKEEDEYTSQVQVTAFEGGSMSFMDIFGGEEDDDIAQMIKASKTIRKKAIAARKAIRRK